MPALITDTITSLSEVVLVERKTSSEFKVREIQESIEDRRVHVEIEFGPFVEEDGPVSRIRGSGGRGITVWEGDEYDTIRDTWTNVDLLNAIKSKL